MDKKKTVHWPVTEINYKPKIRVHLQTDLNSEMKNIHVFTQTHDSQTANLITDE